MFICKKIKIELNKQDKDSIEFMQKKCRGLYNWWIYKLKNGERILHGVLQMVEKSFVEIKTFRYVLERQHS